MPEFKKNENEESSSEIQEKLDIILSNEGLIDSVVDLQENNEICREIRSCIEELKKIVIKRNIIISDIRGKILPMYSKEVEEKKKLKKIQDECKKKVYSLLF